MGQYTYAIHENPVGQIEIDSVMHAIHHLDLYCRTSDMTETALDILKRTQLPETMYFITGTLQNDRAYPLRRAARFHTHDDWDDTPGEIIGHVCVLGQSGLWRLVSASELASNWQRAPHSETFVFRPETVRG